MKSIEEERINGVIYVNNEKQINSDTCDISIYYQEYECFILGNMEETDCYYEKIKKAIVDASIPPYRKIRANELVVFNTKLTHNTNNSYMPIYKYKKIEQRNIG